MSDPIQVDERIQKGSIVVDERGNLFVALGRFYRQTDRTPNGWHGIGFNGKRAKAEVPEFVASSINAYINDTYREHEPTPEHEVSTEDDNP
jgi:hypothetical protein